MKSKCENCPYNRNELGNGCGNDYCMQESMMFDVSVRELKLDKIDTTPTDFTKISKECDVESLERVTEYLKAEELKNESDKR